ncbi:hypothetical protein DQK91_07695 [Oceanidesulfovibrio marinus]|uniref:Radical SAM core domain-containing protein n=2 Tax=Oceanidesulfovibrio marinus TaxID=370038 RepID=A0A6P1ZH30_9BACT|nr:hypothetical protein DQK91_07695 [Oceanidesulfovibrio marinus]
MTCRWPRTCRWWWAICSPGCCRSGAMSSSQLSLDGHKLIYHPDRLADFLAGRDIRPLYAEISPNGHCNHRCLFCNFNYLGHKSFFPEGRMPELVKELAAAGVKGIVFAGAGEPTLHKDTFAAVHAAKEAGADVAMSTNGAMLTPEQINAMAEELTWVRFSISGGTPESYARVHRGRPGDFEKVLSNIARLREVRDRISSPITIGSQCVLLPENHEDIPALAATLKQRGAHYFVIKHFYPHNKNEYAPDMSFLTDEYLAGLQEMADSLTTDDFACILRSKDTLQRNRPYTQCHGLPFILYVREDGSLYSCFSHQDDPNTVLGNVGSTSFEDVWNADRKQQAFDYINNTIDKNQCQSNCRHNQINLWLDKLTPPPAHVNFI